MSTCDTANIMNKVSSSKDKCKNIKNKEVSDCLENDTIIDKKCGGLRLLLVLFDN